MEPINCAMERIAAALADYIDLTAGSAAEAGVVVGDADAKLISTFDTDGNDRGLVAAASDHVVSDVYAVEIEGVLVAARAGDGAARIAKATAIASFVGRRTGLESEKFASIALE